MTGPGFAAYGLDGDFNGDCVVDMADLAVLTAHWLGTDCDALDCRGTDLDGSAQVDLDDFGLFGADWFRCNDPEIPACGGNW